MIKIVLLDIDRVPTNEKVIVDSAVNESKTIDYQDIDAISDGTYH